MAADEARIKEESIGIGDEVFLVGLFTQHRGSQRNIPLLRVGNIAAMPEEPVLSNNKFMDAYLVESQLIGGLSGSPVFVHLGAVRPLGGQIRYAKEPIFYLLGVMHSHWDSPNYDCPSEDVFELKRQEKVNMGIAIVVPAQKIAESFEQDWMKKIEEDKRIEWLARKLPFPDSVKEKD
jgi:hypothetical protein